MDSSESITTLLKCAMIAKYGYKPSKRLINEFLSTLPSTTQPLSHDTLVSRFLTFMGKQSWLMNEARDDRIRATFLAFDLKGHGYISKDNLVEVARTVAPTLKETQVEHWFRQIDTDNDGCVTYADFQRMMMFDSNS